VTAPVMRNDAITIGEEEQHLCVPVVRRQRPTVVKRDRLGVLRTPIFVVNLRAVFQCDRSHVPLLHLYCVVLLVNSANDVAAKERGRSIAATEAAATATKSRLFIPLYATLSDCHLIPPFTNHDAQLRKSEQNSTSGVLS